VKIYSTKYWFTRGVEEVESAGPPYDDMVRVFENPGSSKCDYDYLHEEGDEWHRTREEAVKRAYALKTRRLDNLRKKMEKQIEEIEKQIEEVENMTF
jgi:hypothetical protein